MSRWSVQRNICLVADDYLNATSIDYYYGSYYNNYYWRNRRHTLQSSQEKPKDDWKPVRKLHLPRNNMEGTIPAEISLLQSVESIDLRHNRLIGTLPKEIFTSMPKLTTLSVSQNLLTGSLPTEIGLFGSQGKLDKDADQAGLTLDLAHNGFTKTLPKELGQITSLEVLNLADNR